MTFRNQNTNLNREPRAFRDNSIQRLEQRVEDLIFNFDGCLTTFEATSLFTGPSVYFHRETRRFLDSTGSISDCLDAQHFLQLLYATLTAWGLHRMGPGGAKLVDFDVMVESLRSKTNQIAALAARRVDTLSKAEASDVAGMLWAIIGDLRVSSTEAKIVAGTKALHHLLPNLVPPIDREYTFRFFLHVTTLQSVRQGETLELIYPYFRQIGHARRESIDSALANGGRSNTSFTKVIDNAIVGYVLAHPDL